MLPDTHQPTENSFHDSPWLTLNGVRHEVVGPHYINDARQGGEPTISAIIKGNPALSVDQVVHCSLRERGAEGKTAIGQSLRVAHVEDFHGDTIIHFQGAWGAVRIN
ncbi:hypothetical protein [Acidisoma sp. L85]|uniref:hypothetical protein n=1 Tax=Acidisoma sp. L85 TaxID=1641850 RepID=UPI00131B2D20|nr:hypothetical protein [Acidisoma sp. L85]